MKKSFFILLLLIQISSTLTINENLLPIDKTLKPAKKISHCVKEATTTLFAPSNDVSIIVPNLTNYFDILEGTLDGLIANRIVKIFTQFPEASKSESDSLIIRESSYVVIENSVSLRQLLQNSYVNNWSEYIIVTEGTIQWLKELAESLWNLTYSKVAFVQIKSNGEINFFRLIPESSSRGSTSTLFMYDICNKKSVSSSSENHQKASSIVHPFSSYLKIPVNSTVKFTGILGGIKIEEYLTKNVSNYVMKDLGVEIMEIFAAKYNINLMQHEWTNYQEANWTDAMFRCAAGEMDFYWSHSPPTEFYALGLVEPTNWHKYEIIIFVESLQLSLHLLTGYLHAYEVQVWMCICSLLSAMSFFAYLIDAFKHRGLIRERITVLNVWSVFSAQPLAKLPVRFSLRFVVGMWILYNVIISNVYTATYGSDLTAPHEARRLKNFQDIFDSGQSVCVGKSIQEHFNDADDPVMRGIYPRLEVVLPKQLFKKILEEGCIGSRHLEYVHEHNWKNRRNHSLLVYTISDSVLLSYPSFIYTKRHHPYSKAFTKLVSNIRDTGIMDYLENLHGKVNAKAFSSTNEGEFLQLKHLVSIFIMLSIGLLTSSIVFAIEIFMYKKLGR